MKLHKADILLAGAILAAAFLIGAFQMAQSSQAVTAQIYQDNQLIRTVWLSSAPDETIEIGGAYPLTIVIQAGKIGFQNAACPDQLCQHYGMIDKAGQTAVCLPNRTVIRLEGQPKDDIIRVHP